MTTEPSSLKLRKAMASYLKDAIHIKEMVGIMFSTLL